MIDRYGKDAVSAVDMRIKELKALGQDEALELWLEIRKSVQFMTSKPDEQSER